MSALSPPGSPYPPGSPTSNGDYDFFEDGIPPRKTPRYESRSATASRSVSRNNLYFQDDYSDEEDSFASAQS